MGLLLHGTVRPLVGSCSKHAMHMPRLPTKPGSSIRCRCTASPRRLKFIQEQQQMSLAVAAASLILHATCAGAVMAQSSSDSMNDIPPELSSDGDRANPQSLGKLMTSKEVQGCARPCVATCIRGGGGAPGLGPLSQRRDLIVFKEGYRSRQYCLSECIQVCAAALNPKK